MRSSVTHITYNKVCHMALTVLCAASLFSCVKVDLCAEEEHPHTGTIHIVYHWPESRYEGEKFPDSMLVLANRIINTRRVGYVTDNLTSVGGRYRFGEVHRSDENDKGRTGDKGGQNPLAVSAGEYQIFAFNHVVDDRYYRIDSLEEYSTEEHFASVGIRDLSISYVGQDLTSLQDYNEVKYKDWKTFNDYTTFIEPNATPIYRATNYHDEATQEYTVNIRSNEERVVELYPQRITQDISFSFPIYTDKEVTIDRIIAEISGIPRKMNIYTGVIVADTTYRMLFDVFPVREKTPEEVVLNIEYEDGSVVGSTFIKQECIGNISVMGLMANQNASHRTGAGILQLCIYASVENDGGEKKSKVQYAKINLYNTIKKANLLIKNEQGEVMQNPGTNRDRLRTDTLRIDDSRLMITRDLILKTSDDDVSVDTWLKAGNGDINIDI